jgi:hypothetical protein
MQGMCDLVAPLLVIFDDEGTTYSCFCHLMERMSSNFPNGGAMDTHFANMRYVHYTDCKVWYIVYVLVICLHYNRLHEVMSRVRQDELFYEQDVLGAQFVRYYNCYRNFS